MGIVHEPEIRDYWSQDEHLDYSPIASPISRKHFEELTQQYIAQERGTRFSQAAEGESSS